MWGLFNVITQEKDSNSRKLVSLKISRLKWVGHFIGLAHCDDLAGIDHIGWGCKYVPQLSISDKII